MTTPFKEAMLRSNVEELNSAAITLAEWARTMRPLYDQNKDGNYWNESFKNLMDLDTLVSKLVEDMDTLAGTFDGIDFEQFYLEDEWLTDRDREFVEISD